MSIIQEIPTFQVDAALIKTFTDSTVNTLKIQCQVDVVPGAPHVKGEKEDLHAEIAAIVGVNDPKITGTIAIAMTDKFFLKLMTNMLGEPYTEVTTELEDGAAEILNMIFGMAKVTLNQRGFTLEKAIPTIVRGPSVRMRHRMSDPVYVIPFKCDGELFQVEFGLMDR